MRFFDAVAAIEHRLFALGAILVQILLEGQIFALHGLKQQGVLDPLIELLVPDAAILDEGMDVVPILLVVLALGVVFAHQAVGHLAGDVGRNLFHIPVVLQEGTRDVQRQFRAIDNALEQHQELGNDFLNIIRHEHLAAEQLDLALGRGKLVLDLGEIQNTLEVERVFRVQVNPEQRLLVIMDIWITILYIKNVN